MSKLALLGGKKTIVRNTGQPGRRNNPESFDEAFAKYEDWFTS